MTCVGIMTIATENVNEKEIENVNQAEDHPSGNGNRNGNVNGNGSGIVETNEETPRIAQDTKKKKRKRERIHKDWRDDTRCTDTAELKNLFDETLWMEQYTHIHIHTHIAILLILEVKVYYVANNVDMNIRDTQRLLTRRDDIERYCRITIEIWVLSRFALTNRS